MALNSTYDPTHEPMALFKNKFMRKPDKAALWNALLTGETDIPAKQRITYVIDDRALFHQVHWVKDMKFCDIANQYVCYVRRNYGSVSIVFDGYETMRCQ